MYSYDEIREALIATLIMTKGDFSGEDYIDSLAKAATVMADPEDDKSFELFTKIFEDYELVSKLSSLKEEV